MPREDAAQFNGTLSTATYPNKYSTVIPAEAPFYRIGLTLTTVDKATNQSRKLIEGLDYYLGHYFKELSEAENDAVYGSIMLLNATEIEYELLSAGRQYQIPASEIGKYLVRTDNKDPRNCDWSELMKYPPIISPIDPPKDLDEAILRDEVVKALDDVRKGIIARSSELDAAFAEVTDLIHQNGVRTFSDELYQHHLNQNPHNYTCGDIGALPAMGKAVDATRAFGRTLAELVTLMSTSGIQQRHLDALMDNTLGDLLGRMRVLSNDAITFQTTTGHVISMKGDKFIITSTTPLVLKADQDNNDPGIATEFSAGLNTLYVHSGASDQVLAPVYNGVYLVTPEMVKMYLTSVKLLPANAYFTSSDTLKIYGSGKDTNKVYMNAELPGASTAVEGLFAITNLSASIASSTAISQKAVTDLRDLLDKYVDDTYTINGKGFVIDAKGESHLTLESSDFGIEHMDNTPPLAKPVSRAMESILLGKAVSDHTHTLDDVDNVPYASTSVSGLTKLWDAIDSTSDKMVTARQGFLLDERIEVLNEKIGSLLPAWTVEGASFGNDNFLPIPVSGNYAGFTKNQTWQKGLIHYENGLLYSLRNGSNGIPPADWAIYYAYMKPSRDPAITDLQQTSVKYHPAGMASYPGVTLQMIVTCGTDGMICGGSDGKYYLVLFDGTIDHARHKRVIRVNLGAYQDGKSNSTVTNTTWYPRPENDDVVVVGNDVFILRTVITNTDYYVSVRKVSASQFVAGGELEFQPVTLSGGVLTSGQNTYLRFGQDREGGTTYANPVSRRTAAALVKWDGSNNFVHGPEANHAVAVQDGTVRVGICPTCWFANMIGESINFVQWQTSYLFNTSTMALTLEHPELFPVTQDGTTTICYGNGNPIGLPSPKWGAGSANNRTFAASQDGYILSQGLSDDKDLMPSVYVGVLPAGNTWYDFLACDFVHSALSFATITLNQGRGSVYEPGMAYAMSLGANSKLLWYTSPRSRTCVEVEFDTETRYPGGLGGFGPTNNRRYVDPDTFENLAQMCHIVTPVSDGDVLNGWYCTGPETFPYQNVPGTFTVAAPRYTFSSTEWNKMRQMIIDHAPAGEAGNYASERILAASNAGTMLVSVWFIGIGTPQELTIAQVVCPRRVDNANLLDIYYFFLKPTFNNDQVTFPAVSLSLLEAFNDKNWTLNYATLGEITGGKKRRVGQPLLLTVDNVNYGLHLPYTLTLRTIGDLNALNYDVGLQFTGGVWSRRTDIWSDFTKMAPSYFAVSRIYLSQLGGVMLDGYSPDPVFSAGGLFPSAHWANNPPELTSIPDVVIAGVETAEGWVVYLTEEVKVRFGSKSYTLPTWSLDLSTAFPTYQNTTFYLHVRVVNGVPEYFIDTTRHPDTPTQLYAGYLQTDANRITTVNVNKVKSLGAIKQLEEHTGVATQHDMNTGRDFRIGKLGLLRKAGMGGLSLTPNTEYMDSQLFYTVAEAQPRARKGIGKRFSGLRTLPSLTQANTAAKLWSRPTSIKTVQASENSEAASRGMQWLGFAIPSAHPMASTAIVAVQGTFVAPGTVGDAVSCSIRVALWKDATFFQINAESEGEIINVPGDAILPPPPLNTVDLFPRTVVAGKPSTFSMTMGIPWAKLSSASGRFCAWMVSDANGNTLPVNYTTNRIAIMSQTGAVYGSAVAINARDYTFVDVQGCIPVVTTGVVGLSVPWLATWNGNDLTLTVAHEFVNERGRQLVDEIQINLMFSI